MRRKTVTIVMPVFNEEENLEQAYQALKTAMSDSADFDWLLVDDGSTDDSRRLIETLAHSDERIHFIFLSRNFGHQSAVRAGILAAQGDSVIVMDADLQHPVELIPELISNWRSGSDIVLTKRNDTQDQSSLKRFTSAAYYRALQFLTDTKIVAGLADFYLLDRKVIEALRQYDEADLYLRGVIPNLGFEQVVLPYTPNQRHAGESKYTVRKMVQLALNGMLSMTVRPLRLATLLAMFVGITALVYSAFALISFLVFGNTIPGWTSVIVIVSIIGAMQLFVLGVIGEYLGKVLRTARKQPHFIVSRSNLDEE